MSTSSSPETLPQIRLKPQVPLSTSTNPSQVAALPSKTSVSTKSTSFNFRTSDSTNRSSKKSQVAVKSYPHPWESRICYEDSYECPITGREAWWRGTIRATPIPGSYDYTDFLEELARRPNSYGFKSDGRKHSPDFAGKGILLLPGGYEYQDFVEKLAQKPATYRFKAGSRDAVDVLNFGKKDKDINVAPNAYDMDKVLAIHAEKQPVKNFMFKSQSKRFPTQSFGPKEGPSPGMYNVKNIAPPAPTVTSSFRSKTPRFQTSHTSLLSRDSFLTL